MLLTEEEVLTLQQGLDLILDGLKGDDIALARQLKDKLLELGRVRVEAKGEVTLALGS